MIFEGKVANRLKIKYYKNSGTTICGKCRTEIPWPEEIQVGSKKSGYFYCQSYLNTDHFVYETQGGDAICYCSKYCANKHNHRFRK